MKEQWRGVNLGGWLVLEKWMTPSLFTGTNARDEYELSRQLGPENIAGLLKAHRDNFITEADFGWTADYGLNAVRLPVGYWVFGDEAPYVGGIEYVDKAFEWAAKHGLGILLDLHGAPGSQNGNDHSGRVGNIGWGDEPTVQNTLEILERLAERYGNKPALIGIELMNEPSYRLSRRLPGFYEQAYERIRRHCDKSVAVVFHDAFRPRRWKDVLAGPSHENVMIDHHYYQVFGWRDRHRSLTGQLKRPRVLSKRITALQKQRPCIIGEWSLALSKPVEDSITRAYAVAQLRAMAGAHGWFFWSYKTEAGGAWSYRDCIAKGWLPSKYDQP